MFKLASLLIFTVAFEFVVGNNPLPQKQHSYLGKHGPQFIQIWIVNALLTQLFIFLFS